MIPSHFAHFSDAQEYLSKHAGGSPFDYTRDNPQTLHIAESLGIGPQVSKAIEMSRALDGDVAVSVSRAARLEAKGRPINGAAHDKLSEYQPIAADVSADVVEASADAGNGWPELQPLVVATKSDPYPLEAFPPILGEAVREVLGFVQCPPALAGCSALSAVSLVVQGLANVRRADKLEGPTSLYVLAIADSGERKSTCDGFFVSSIRSWEGAQRENRKAEQAKHAADFVAWEATRAGLVSKIKENSAKGSPSKTEQEKLHELEANKPEAPRIPRLLLGEATPEALTWNLAHGWPVTGILSSEAGIIFGGHGMKSDTLLRNLGQLNVLWDGGTLRTERKTSESFTVEGARLTLGLAAQPDTVRAFMESTKGLARGTGFAARFLIAWPESTQGDRPHRNSPEGWPKLAAFHRRITDLLRLHEDLKLTDAGGIGPPVLDFTPEAKAAWISFHDAIETELRTGGDMEQTRDVASKAADNAARLAGIFHVFEHGPEGAISETHLRAAAALVSWHLYEARRFLGELALPVAIVNASALEAWVLRRCRTEGAGSIRRQEVQNLGPLRDGKTLNAAIADLQELGRMRLVIEGRQKRLYPRPSILAWGNHA